MSESNARIEQFKKMAEADPNNELGHFSLGKEYLQLGQPAEAVTSFDRALHLNPNLSKVYQLAAQAHLKLEQREAAIARLTQGVQVATERGDLMPKNEMVKMLQDLGAPIPASVATTREVKAATEGEIVCARCGQVKPRMAKPPWSHASGKEIQEKICQECWREWIGMGTKVINELRLPMSDPQAQKVWDQHMREFLNLK